MTNFNNKTELQNLINIYFDNYKKNPFIAEFERILGIKWQEIKKYQQQEEYEYILSRAIQLINANHQENIIQPKNEIEQQKLMLDLINYFEYKDPFNLK
jgi:hypothetical protein